MLRLGATAAHAPFAARVDARIIPALALFLPDPNDESPGWDRRMAFDGLQIEPHQRGGVTVLATDGNAMLVVYDPTGDVRHPAIARVPRRLVSACCPTQAPHLSAEGEDVTPELPGWMRPRWLALWSVSAWVLPDVHDHEPGSRGTLAHAMASTDGIHRYGEEYRMLDRPLTDWRAILPKRPRAWAPPASTSAEYLRRYAVAAKVLGAHGLRFSGSGKESGGGRFVEFVGCANAIGLLMPLDISPVPAETLPPRPAVPEWALMHRRDGKTDEHA